MNPAARAIAGRGPGGRCGGFTLIELLIAWAMSLAVVAGGLTLFVHFRDGYRTQSFTRHIQENGRFALQVVARDLRMAGYAGMNIRPQAIDVSDADVSTLTHCGEAGWATRVSQPLGGSNNANAYGDCINSNNYVAGTDVLVLRHVDGRPTTASGIRAGRLYLYTSLYSGRIFRADANNAIDADTLAAVSESPVALYPVSASLYFVRPCGDMSAGAPDRCDDGDDSVPTLMRRTLTGTEALVENVENFQVLFGIDTDGDAAVDRYVSAHQVGDWQAVLAVRMFLLARSPEPVTGYRDTAVYEFGDVSVTPAGADAGYYRKLFSTTLFLRNPPLDRSAL